MPPICSARFRIQQEQLFRFRFQMGMGQKEGLKKYRDLKKDRARMLTVLREKQASGEVDAQTVQPLPRRSEEKKKKRFWRFRK